MEPAARTFGRYRIVRPIGRGGMGAVFEAEHLHLGKRVALKTLPGLGVGDARAIERFLREGRAAARVRHPHVVDVTDVGLEDGVPYLVMELLEGEDLAARLREAGALTVTEALELLLPIVAAVDAMHRLDIVHRDLKPENIFLARELGRVVPRVVDFGVSRPERPGAPGVSADSGLVGTPYYLSPEQVDGARGDARSDQHALGVIAYECLAGARPFEAPTLLELLARVRDGRRDDLRARRPELPQGLADTIHRAMNPTPAARFESVRAFGDALACHATARAVETWRELTAALAPTTTPAAVDERAPAPAARTRLDGSPAPSPPPLGATASDPSAALHHRPRRRTRLVGAAVIAALGVLAGRGLRTSAPATQRPAPAPIGSSPRTATPTPPPALRAAAPTNPDVSAPTPTAPTRPPSTPRRIARAPTAARATAPAPPPIVPAASAPTPLTPAPPHEAPPPPAPERPVVNGAPIVD